MRLYRKVFPNKSKSRLDETVQSVDIERGLTYWFTAKKLLYLTLDKQLIEKTSPIRTRIVRRNLKSDDLIQVYNYFNSNNFIRCFTAVNR